MTDRAVEARFPRLQIPGEVVFEFLGCFARSEYALKASGFLKGDETSVWPDWDAFAKAIEEPFRKVDDKEVLAAVEFLLGEPPRKQVLKGGRVGWETSPPDKKLSRLEQVLLMIRRVRNNLFHGGKGWSPEGARERDIRLLKEGLRVLLACVQMNSKVLSAYEVGVSEEVC